MIDFHTHIIPDIDDGSHTVDESIEMLKMCYAQGMDTVILSSHFRLGEHRIKSYLKDRQNRLDMIRDALTDEERKIIPKIILGCEIEYHSSINSWDYLGELAIKGTNYVMTEMPFIPWSKEVVNNIDKIALNTQFTPILPHIDRYFHTFTKESYIRHYFDMPEVLLQMNAIYINNYNNIQFYKPLFDNGIIDIIGSDCHGTEWRPPDLGRSVKMLREVCGQELVDRIDRTGREIIKNAIYEEM
ncbi:MAG: hypothetical protein IKV96_01705 [Firmicutes bacterium]|nr:hypothetical protein [Bacillota bacterium]